MLLFFLLVHISFMGFADCGWLTSVGFQRLVGFHCCLTQARDRPYLLSHETWAKRGEEGALARFLLLCSFTGCARLACSSPILHRYVAAVLLLNSAKVYHSKNDKVKLKCVKKCVKKIPYGCENISISQTRFRPANAAIVTGFAAHVQNEER